MPASDVLKTLRGNSYGKTSVDQPEGDDAEQVVSDSPRLLKLTDEEAKSLNGNPGDDMVCEVHGTLDGEGMFRVMSIGPMGGDEKAMADQVIQKVAPNIAPSPS